ncbi:RNA polymerase sigma factor SigJ [Arthrobacter monumenti]
MDELDLLAERFEAHRPHLRAVGYRMLGSLSEADDAVQETWLRASRADVSGVENLAGWLTTVAGRVCLNMLRTRNSRREEPLGVHMPDPVVSRVDDVDPADQALLSESVGIALLVVLDTLDPAERLAFVLHDMFSVPFEEIAPVVERSTTAARQLASRARRRVQQQVPTPDVDPARQREVVDAFFAASRDGDFSALVAVLDPDAVLRSDGGFARPAASVLLRGGATIAKQALTYGQLAPHIRPVHVNGTAGVVVVPHGRPVSVMAFTVRDGRITAIDVLADPDRLEELDVAVGEN